MTRTTNARIASAAFLAYIAAGITDMVISGRAKAGADAAARLATIAQHSADFRAIILLEFTQCFCALLLGVTLWAITREQDRDIATLAMICRVLEGAFAALSIPTTLSLLWLATGRNDISDPAIARALAAYLFKEGGGMAFTATFFAVGSLLFAWLLLRGRMIPAALAWIGVLASVLLVLWLPLQLAGILPNATWIWIPMFLFEVPVAFWLLIKGVAPAHSASV